VQFYPLFCFVEKSVYCFEKLKQSNKKILCALVKNRLVNEESCVVIEEIIIVVYYGGLRWDPLANFYCRNIHC
jgi:hypothetical protein